MDAVSKIDGHSAHRQVDNITTRRKHKHLVGENIHLHRIDEIAGIAHILMPFQQLTQPRQLGVKGFIATGCGRGRLAAAAFLIAPVGGDTVFRNTVHLKSPDLDLQRLTVAIQHSSMQRLVHIRLRHSNIILKAARYRAPHTMHHA